MSCLRYWALGGGQEEREAGNSSPAVNLKEFLKPIPDLQKPGIRDLQEKIMDGVMGDLTDLHKKDEQLYRLGLVNQENWKRYEEIAFNRVDVQNFAKQAIADEAKDKVSEEEVIQYFGLDTTVGRMKFRKTMDAGMPELLATGKLKGAFNKSYLDAKDKILRADLNSKEFLIREETLKILPREIGRLVNLERLDLQYNQLTSLPAELGNLRKLKILPLSENQLTSVPAELGNLTNLEELYLRSNQLTSVPAELGNLTNLGRLDLIANKLTSLPAELGNLRKLKIFSLSDNQLTSVPAELGNLTNLGRLDLSSNQLTSMPAELGNLTNLVCLDLITNELTSLPAELGNLRKLLYLAVSFNRLLTTLPDSLSPANKPDLHINGFNGSFVPPK